MVLLGVCICFTTSVFAEEDGGSSGFFYFVADLNLFCVGLGACDFDSYCCYCFISGIVGVGVLLTFLKVWPMTMVFWLGRPTMLL